MQAIALALVLTISGSTAIVAESALPGDTLYGVKVAVNENVKAAVSVGAEAEAKWKTRQVERRAEEAAKLHAEGKLSGEIIAELENKAKIHREEARRALVKLRANTESSTDVALASHLEGVLNASSDTMLSLRALATSENSVKVNTNVDSRVDAEAETRNMNEGLHGTSVNLSVGSESKAQTQSEIRTESSTRTNTTTEVAVETRTETNIEAGGASKQQVDVNSESRGTLGL